MFGYLRIFKPMMRFCEYDTYKAVYCALCKKMGKEYGLLSRFTLSYDLTFLGLLDIALNDYKVCPQKQRCIAHPFKKSLCACCENGLDNASDCMVILTHHKLCDDIADRGFFKKIVSYLYMPISKKSYKKAMAKNPELAKTVEEQMKNQLLLERENCKSLDRAADPTALMTAACFESITDDQKQKRVLHALGYQLGRYIFYCDALDDVKDDYKSGSYNPLLANADITKTTKELSQDDLNKLRQTAQDAVMLSLGEMSNAYVLLDLKKYKDILDNIVYLGLKNTFKLVYNEINLKKIKNKHNGKEE